MEETTLTYIFDEIKPAAFNKTDLRKLKTSLQIKRISAGMLNFIFQLSFLVIIFLPLIIFGNQLNKIYKQNPQIFLGIVAIPVGLVSLAIYAFTYERTKAFIYRCYVKFPTRSERDYALEIKNMVSAMAPVLELKHPVRISEFVRHLFRESLENTLLLPEDFLKQKVIPENLCLFLVDYGQDKFLPRVSLGLNKAALEKAVFSFDSRLIFWLNKLKDSLVKDSLSEEIAKQKSGDSAAFEIAAVKKEMDLIKAEVCVPLFYSGYTGVSVLAGFLSVGKGLLKKYNEDVLDAICRLEAHFRLGLSRARYLAATDKDKQKQISNKYIDKTEDNLALLDKEIIFEEAKRIASGEDEKIAQRVLKNPLLTAWCRFDNEVHTQGLTSGTQALLQQHFGLKLPLGFRIQGKMQHGEKVNFYIKVLIELSGLTNDLAALRKSIKEEKLLWLAQQTEWFDGSGYPDGLKGEVIHILSRITTLAEAFDIFYECFKDTHQALDAVDKFSGTRFDPKLIRLLRKAAKRELVPLEKGV